MTMRIASAPVGKQSSVSIALPEGARLISFYMSAGTAGWALTNDSGERVIISTAGSRGTTLAGESWKMGKGYRIEAFTITNQNATMSLLYDDRDVVNVG